MSYLYKLSNTIDNSFENTYKFKSNIHFNYNKEEYFHSYSGNDVTLICYGYCFDIRNPKKNINETLQWLVESDEISIDLSFLNGQFILIMEKESRFNLYTDASSLIPVYFSSDDYIVTNQQSETTNEYLQLNPAYKLDLNNYQVDKILEKANDYANLDNNSLTDYLISLLSEQYKYFFGKKIIIPFKADNFTKSLFAILSPILNDNIILLNPTSVTDKDEMFAEIFKNEFRMELYEELNKIEGTNYYCKNNLSNFNAIYSKNNDSKNSKWFFDYYEYDIKELTNHEYNLMNLNNKSNFNLSRDFLIYEPLNSREILNVFIELSKRTNYKIHISIINEMKKSLRYYNFTNGKTLSDINLELKNKVDKLINSSMESPTQKFLLDVKTSNFTVSQNLAGKIKNEEIIVYPSRQKISKTNIYTISYSSSEEGFIFIEGFYKNEKNAHRIKVWVNDEELNILDLYGGRYFYFKNKCDITLKYEQDYEGLSWQKAGTLAVKKI